MKVYLGLRRENDKVLYGITIYHDKSALLYSDTRYFDVSATKFGNMLELLRWGALKVKTLGQNGKIPMDEKVLIIFNSNTIYGWLNSEKAPKRYIIPYHDMLVEWNFVANEQEFIYSASAVKRVLFGKTTQEESVSARDLFAIKG